MYTITLYFEDGKVEQARALEWNSARRIAETSKAGQISIQFPDGTIRNYYRIEFAH